MVSGAQHVCIENARLNALHKVLLAAFLSLIVARTIILKLWQREFDIATEIFFSLDASGTDRYDALNSEWSDLLSSNFCNASAMYNYNWLHPDEDARGRFKFADFDCPSPCLPGRYEPLPCSPSWDLVQRPTPATILLVTSRRSTNYSTASKTDSLSWIAGAKSVDIDLSFGFSAAATGFDQTFWDRNARLDSEARSLMTAVVDSTGAVTRTLKRNDRLKFTLSELLALAGQADWLDSIVMSVGPNRLPGAPLQHGASARLTGGQLKIHISCSDELDFDLGDVSWDEDYVCSVRASIYDATFQNVQRSEMSGDSIFEHTFYGIEIAVTTGGSLHTADPDALLYLVVSSMVLLTFPGIIIVCCALTCCGRISAIYYQACYDECSLSTCMSAKVADMISYVDSFKELDDKLTDVPYLDERKVQGGISMGALQSLMQQVFCPLHDEQANHHHSDMWRGGHTRELESCVNWCFDFIAAFQSEEESLSPHSHFEQAEAYDCINLHGHLHFASNTERFTTGSLLGMFQSSHKRGCLELFFTPLDYDPSYWREPARKAKRKRPISGAIYDEDVVRMLGPSGQMGSQTRRQTSKEELMELQFKETTKENEVMQHKIDRCHNSLEVCYRMFEEFDTLFDVYADRLAEERKHRKARRKRRRQEKARKRAARNEQLAAFPLGPPVGITSSGMSASSASSAGSSQLEDALTMASEMRVKMRNQLANIGERLSRLDSTFPVKQKRSQRDVKYRERLPRVSHAVQHEKRYSESWSAIVCRQEPEQSFTGTRREPTIGNQPRARLELDGSLMTDLQAHNRSPTGRRRQPDKTLVGIRGEPAENSVDETWV